MKSSKNTKNINLDFQRAYIYTSYYHTRFSINATIKYQNHDVQYILDSGHPRMRHTMLTWNRVFSYSLFWKRTFLVLLVCPPYEYGLFHQIEHHIPINRHTHKMHTWLYILDFVICTFHGIYLFYLKLVFAYSKTRKRQRNSENDYSFI